MGLRLQLCVGKWVGIVVLVVGTFSLSAQMSVKLLPTMARGIARKSTPLCRGKRQGWGLGCSVCVVGGGSGLKLNALQVVCSP